MKKIYNIKVYQGRDYTDYPNPNRLNDYHMVWYLFGIPTRTFMIKGLDDWAKSNTFRGMTVTKWNGEEEIPTS